MTASLLAGCGSSAAPAASAVASASASASASGAKYNTGMPELDSILNNATGRLADILAAGKITCVSEVAFAPYEFVDPDISNEQDSYVGSDMELARYIASCLGVKLEIDNVVWDAVATGVQDGKYDMQKAKGAVAVARPLRESAGVNPTRNHWNRVFTPNTIKGEMHRARGSVIFGNFTSAPIPTTVSNPAKHHQTISTTVAKEVTLLGMPAMGEVNRVKSILLNTLINQTIEAPQKKYM